MVGQWYLLGKEIDHRLKIYFRANSSIDRILYRLFSGCDIMMLIFNLFSLLPSDYSPLWILDFLWLLGYFLFLAYQGKNY
jgi:hypothetical protein